MKTIEEIIEMNDKERVSAVAGILVAIDTPREPTPAQESRGLHVQNFRIQSSRGTILECQMLNAAMHLKPELRGDLIVLKSADTERGPSGLSINIYNGKLSLVVSKDASFSLKERKADSAPQPETQAAPDETHKQLKQRTSAGPNIHSATLAYVAIYRTLITELAKTETVVPTFVECQSAIATIFIEGGRGGFLYQPIQMPLPPPLHKMEEVKPEIAPDPNQVLKHILTDAINGTLDRRIEQADRAISLNETLTWDSVYDGLVSFISVEEKIPLATLLPIANSVYDTLRRNLGPKSAGTDISRAIAMDFKTFEAEVKAAMTTGSPLVESKNETTTLAPKTETDQYDDIPL